jgi:hypothetical protein
VREAVQRLYQGLQAVLRRPASSAGLEQRRLIRISCDFRVRCVQDNGSEFEGRIVDLALSGLRLVTDRKLEARTRLYVHLLDPILEGENEQVFCGVRWSRHMKDSPLFESGLLFLDTPGSARKSWIKFLLREVGFDEQSVFSRRKLLRAGTALPAELVGPGKLHYPARLVNLGVGGCLLSLASNPDPAPTYDLRLGPTATFKLLYVHARVKQSALEKSEATALVPETRRPSAEPKPGGRYLVGIEFDSLSAAQTRLLGEYVLNLLKNSDSAPLG